MRINKKKQAGATMITWMVGAIFAVLVISAVVKLVPSYLEFNSVKAMMKSIASQPGVSKGDKRRVMKGITSQLSINSLSNLEDALKDSKDRTKDVKSPFKISKVTRGGSRHKLTVEYPVVTKWIGNISFLLDFKHTVILGEPENTTGK